MSNRASLELTLGSPAMRDRKPPEEPLRLLFMADLSGRISGDSSFKTFRVSHETLDSTLRTLTPEIPVNIDAPLAIQETVTCRSIDDFHPDSLLKSISAFRTLDILGDRLGDPKSRDEALQQLGELIGTGIPTAPAEGPLATAEPQSSGEDEGNMMERLLGASAGRPKQTRAQQKVESFIRNVMDESSIETPSVTTDVGRQQLDELKTETLRAVLMSEPLRALERAWRSVEFLVKRLDSEAVELHVVDLSKSDLAANLSANAGQLDQSALHRLFCEPPSGHLWDLLVGNYTFALDADDLVILTTIGAIASQAGAPFLAHGDLSLCGCPSLDQLDVPWDWQSPEGELGELWLQVRSHPAAQWVGLATPRVVLRQPYGPETDPIDAFDFRELPARPESGQFLWGNPAIGCAYLLGRARAEERDFSRSEDLEVDDLPAVLYDDGTGQALQPPVEALIGERAMNRIQTSGLMPMLGRRDSNAVRCADLIAVSSTVTRFIA